MRTENPCVGGSISPLATTYSLIISKYKRLRTNKLFLLILALTPHPPLTFFEIHEESHKDKIVINLFEGILEFLTDTKEL